ncbi:flippase [Halomonas rhizosphaerae]|uniref:Flippase n=1 Tax=Halomonas rhizosphaerae TaxID=3043296 RepID=A0ABT6V011_9GAMM|nr:flippase [Halomonas rhizosphaerae]MDI5890287.1 flippase [Halomonas rhizosphaerae]
MNTATFALITKLRGHLQGGGLKAQLLRGGIGSIAVKIAHTGLAFLLAVLLARTLGPEGYGIYSFAFALVSLMAVPSQLGLPELMVRETAKAQAHEQWGLLRGLWRWSSLTVWGFSSLIALAALTGIWLFGDGMGNAQRQTLLVSLLLIPLVALGNLRGAALKGLRRVVLGQLPESVLRPAILIGLTSAIWLLVGSITPMSAMGLHAIAAAVAFIIGAFLLWRARPQSLGASPTPQFQSRQWLSSALPLAMIAGLQLINNQTDIIMLGIFRSPEEVGVYKVVVASAAFVTFGLQAVNAVVSPYFAKYYIEGDMMRFQTIVKLSTRASLVMGLPVASIFLLLGDQLLGVVFGEEYVAGYNALMIIIIGQVVNVCVGLVGTILVMTGNEKSSLFALVVSSLVNVSLNVLLIPFYGIQGAAIASVMTIMLWNFFMWHMVKKKLNIQTGFL